MRILAISGSIRAQSSNTELLRAAALIAPTGVQLIEYQGLATLPIFNPDDEEAGRLGLAQDLRDAVAGAAALIICSPEYAHGVPGALKNALDWLVGGPELPGKPVAIWNASTGLEFAPAQLRETLRTMSADVRDDAALAVSLRGRQRDAQSIAEDVELAAPIRVALGQLITPLRGGCDGR